METDHVCTHSSVCVGGAVSQYFCRVRDMGVAIANYFVGRGHQNGESHFIISEPDLRQSTERMLIVPATG